MNYVLEPTSILVSRRARRTKTDRLDAQGLLRVLTAYHRGERHVCSVVRVPTPNEEDAKRQHREREHLVKERVRIENRIEALLATQGVRKRPSLRSWDRDLESLRTGDGRLIPMHLRAEFDRLRRRLVATIEMIREVEAERAQDLNEEKDDPANKMIRVLCRIRGIGENVAAVLTREVFYRPFSNRRQIASYVGLAPMPFQSGEIDRDRRISRAASAHHDHPVCMAVAALSARQCVVAVVPRAGRGITGTHPSHRHRRHGAQVASCDLALRDTRGRPCRRSDRIGECRRRVIAAGCPGGVTVLIVGGRSAPRFRWVTFCWGRRLVHEASWYGPIVDPTACKVTRRSSRNDTDSEPDQIQAGKSREATSHGALTIKPSCKDEMRVGQKNS